NDKKSYHPGWPVGGGNYPPCLDRLPAQVYARFGVTSRRSGVTQPCPLCAISGQMHRNKGHARVVKSYSVTSSRDRTPRISRNGEVSMRSLGGDEPRTRR